MPFLRPILVLVLVIWTTSHPLYAERRVALVIGNAAYVGSVNALRNPVNDAIAIRTSLKDLGFDVEMELDADRADMIRAIEDFKEKSVGADVALVYFSGHGVEIAGKNLLIPIDVQSVENAAALTAASVDLELFASAATASAAKVLNSARN